MTEKCSHRPRFHPHCQNVGKYEENGVFWCGTHSPARAKARADARLADRRAADDRQWAMRREHDAKVKCIADAERAVIAAAERTRDAGWGSDALNAAVDALRAARGGE
jgi:hypothetical protein